MENNERRNDESADPDIPQRNCDAFRSGPRSGIRPVCRTCRRRSVVPDQSDRHDKRPYLRGLPHLQGKSSQDGSTLSNVAWDTDSVAYNGTESAKDVAEKLAADSAADPGNSDQYIKQLEEKLTLKTPVKTVPSSAGTTAIDLSATGAGYYLVKDKDNSVDSTKTDAYTKYIVQVVGNVSVNVKSDVPNVYKKVKDTNDSDGTTSDWIDSADYDMGDWVPYQITGTMPTNIADYTTYSYAFTDTMSKGLTYDGTDADHKVKILLDDKTDLTKYFTEKAEKKTDGSTVVTWTCADLKAAVKEAGDALTPGSKICAYYSAQLNSKANIEIRRQSEHGEADLFQQPEQRR